MTLLATSSEQDFVWLLRQSRTLLATSSEQDFVSYFVRAGLCLAISSEQDLVWLHRQSRTVLATSSEQDFVGYYHMSCHTKTPLSHNDGDP